MLGETLVGVLLVFFDFADPTLRPGKPRALVLSRCGDGDTYSWGTRGSISARFWRPKNWSLNRFPSG
jgi:hypothetical protein